MTIRTTVPIWGRLYPDLLDVEKVMAAYQDSKNQEKAAEVFGCCEKTFRTALRYHGIRHPIGRVPSKVSSIFTKSNNPECHTGKLTDK